MDDLAAFARLVESLRPWLGKLVVVGGWAHRLHRYHHLANPPSYQPVLTLDADLAFSLAEPLEGDIAAALRAADFREKLTGDHVPPVSRYSLGEEAHGFFAEFLAPLHGSGIKRNGAPDATVTRAGVTAQKLRYLDLLLVHPITVHLGQDVGFPLLVPAEVRLPDPVSFLAQKILIQRERMPRKRQQDVLYIHDTIELFAQNLKALGARWREQLRPLLPPRIGSRVEQLSREQFRETNDVIREAARIPQDRTLTPENVRAVCEYGFQVIFDAA